MSTDNGFEVGDEVKYDLGKGEQTSSIVEVVAKGKWAWIGSKKHPSSIVKLADGTQILDARLTRV